MKKASQIETERVGGLNTGAVAEMTPRRERGHNCGTEDITVLTAGQTPGQRHE